MAVNALTRKATGRVNKSSLAESRTLENQS